jgi:hypothetical protein
MSIAEEQVVTVLGNFHMISDVTCRILTVTSLDSRWSWSLPLYTKFCLVVYLAIYELSFKRSLVQTQTKLS